MLTLLEAERSPCAVRVEVRGYLTWTTAAILLEACQAYARDGLRRIDLVADQLWGVDLLALRALEPIRHGGPEVRVLRAGEFVRCQLASEGFGDWIGQDADAPAAGTHVG